VSAPQYGLRRRRATLVAHLLDLETRLSDAAVGMFVRLILGLFTKARKGIERRYQATAREVADFVAGANRWPTAISTEPPCTQLTPSSAERARTERRHPKASTPKRASALDPLENTIRRSATFRWDCLEIGGAGA